MRRAPDRPHANGQERDRFLSWSLHGSARARWAAPATAPAPTAAPTRNARRASSCLVICDSSRGAFLRPGGGAPHVPECYHVREVSAPLRLRSVSWPRGSALAPDEHSSWSTRWGWPPEELAT